MPFQIKHADITTLRVDAIANAANPALQAGGGVCGAIFAAAGRAELQAACNAIGGCATGDAVITPGFRLPARFIIHTVGPMWRDGNHGEEALLASCYRRSLEVAVENGLRSVAFPLISAGIFGYPREQALAVAEQTVNAFLLKAPELDVTLALYP
ncbi:MAG: macro domain-containing protein [Eubacteriales bacterium]|nr:macro domain-containing protein [Eubacteriales bacterium]